MTTLQQKIIQELKTSDFPWWEWNVIDNKVTFNPLKVTMLGYDIEDFRDCGYQAFTDLLHPEDYERTMEAMRKLLRGEHPIYQIDYRIKTVKGNYKWYMDRGTIIKRTEKGEPAIIRGMVIDLGANLDSANPSEELVRLFRKALPLDAPGKKIIHLCVQCQKVKLEEGKWMAVPDIVLDHNEFLLSHGLCTDCLKILYPELADRVIQRLEKR